MIEGVVCSGAGRAAPAFTPERMQGLVRLFGWLPYPGTLNLRVCDLDAVSASLGVPDAYTEHRTPIGPLRWWRVSIAVNGSDVPGLVVRGERTRTRYLELVAPVRLRDHGAIDGAQVVVRR